VAGESFRDLLAGRLPAMQGERATLSDWSNHLTTIFPEVRLKRYIEMRGADSGPWRRLPTLPALWTGLLYDEDSLEAAWDLVKDWSAAERQQLRDEVPRRGFNAVIAGVPVLDIARTTVELARRGLARRDRNDVNGCDETRYLEPIEDYLERGITPAEELLEKFHGPWGGSVEPVFTEYAY
jgi:glutamate--cysteine ligase